MELLIMACPASCAYNEIRVPLTGPECDTLASGTGIDGITDVCDYLQSLPVRLFDIQNHLEGLGNYGALPVNEDSKCKPSEAPTASSLVSEIARAINAITCFLCGVGGGSKSHFHDETGDFNQLATTPLNIPADLDINDTVIEDFDDYLVFWTWDGTTWTKNFVHDKADANSAFQTHNQNIPTPTYTTPLTPPANPEAGDTIIEQYLDGIVYWTFDGTNWVKNFTDSKDIHSYHVLQAGNAPSLTPIFPVPITTAQAGDTAIVRWDNGEAKYTYNGASWVLDWFNEDASGIECTDIFPNDPNDCATPPAIQDANGNVTVLNGNGNIQTDCTLDVTGGVLGVRKATFIVGPNIAGSTNLVANGGWQLVATLVIPAVTCDRNMRTDFEITIGFNGSPAPNVNDQARFRVLLNGVQIGTQTGVFKPNSSANPWGYELDYDRYFQLASGVVGTLTYEADWVPTGAVSGSVAASIQEPKVMEII